MTAAEPVLDLTRQLVARPSLTPDDAGCQEILWQRLLAAGFECETLRYGDVTNLWARLGQDPPLMALAGHTDVVPTGKIERWSSHPFSPETRGGFLFGRGTADMKAGLAAMTVAAERWARKRSDRNGSLAMLITSDEEGEAVDGTKRVIEELSSRGVEIAYCIVGEPSSFQRLGDQVRIGRRGSLTGRLDVMGRQGHVAFPERTPNPIHATAPLLGALANRVWDRGNASFPATSFQIANVHSGTGAENVIPGELTADFNFRFNTEQTPAALQEEVETALRPLSSKFQVELDWSLSGMPFLCCRGKLLEAVRESVLEHVGINPRLSTSGGTSDGRFIARTGAEVVELGPVHKTIHGIDECVRIADLPMLADIHFSVIERLLR